jgi:hypothetical protein
MNLSEVYDLWDNVEKCGTARQGTDDSIISRMCFACWITKATDALSEYVILIAFPRQKFLRESGYVLMYTQIAYFVLSSFTKFQNMWTIGLDTWHM